MTGLIVPSSVKYIRLNLKKRSPFILNPPGFATNMAVRGFLNKKDQKVYVGPLSFIQIERQAPSKKFIYLGIHAKGYAAAQRRRNLVYSSD